MRELVRIRSFVRSVVALCVGLCGLTLPLRAAGQAPAQPTSLQGIGQQVADPSPEVRRRALRELAERGGPETLPALAPLVTDPVTEIAAGAIEAVIGVYVQPTRKRSMRNAADAFLLAPYRATPWPVPAELADALVTALADDDARIRADAAYAVAIVMPPPASDRLAFELLASLSDREASVRLAAARALGRLEVKSAGVPLIGRINDEDLNVRLASMRALGDLRERTAVAALTEQFSYYVRGSAGRAAIDALARIADPSSASLFETQTASGYPAHRQAAYEGLARLGALGQAAARIEAEIGNEKDKRARTAMAFALASSGRPGVQQILEALADEDLGPTAMGYLVELGRAHAGAIAARLSDPNPVVREQVAIVLGFIGGPEAEAALAGAAAETSAEVRQAIDIAQLRARQLATRVPQAR